MNFMPIAFIGYGLDTGRHGTGLYIRCCSECHDHTALECWADKKKTPVRLEICPNCVQARMSRLLGEQVA